MDVAALQDKVNRLTRELDQANKDVIRSATCGLRILEEKQSLTKRYEELENLYENVKQEITYKAKTKIHKVTTKSGIEQEKSLLYETAALESTLNTTIIEVENYTKSLHQELEHVRMERDQAIQRNKDLSNESKQLRADLREVKSRETCLLSDYSKLEEENIKLQKQIAHLKSSLGSHIRSLEHLGTQTSKVVSENQTEDEISNATLEYYQQWFSVATKEIDQLHDNLEEIERQLNSSEVTLSLKDELIMLKNKSLDREQKTMELESNVSLLGELATDTSTTLNNAQNNLVVITEKLAQLAFQMSMLNGKSITLKTIAVEAEENDPRLDVLQTRLKSHASIQELKSPTEASFIVKSLRNVLDQIKLLKESINTSIDAKAVNRDNSDGQRSLMFDNNDELSDLREQVMKLQSLLATKQEQISSLCMVLKTNQNTAEVSLNNLKSNYDNEKMVVTETMTKRTLKDDDATFSSLRAMFAPQSEEEVTHLYDLQQQSVDAQEENTALTELLRLSVQQKMLVIKIIEEIEKDQEMKNM